MTDTKKDWVGGYNSVFKILGARNNCAEEREPNDLYCTHPDTINALVERVELPHKIWEPSAGLGHLSERLKELGFEVYSTDIIKRSYEDCIGGVNFFEQMAMPEGYTCILTNPPYKYLTQYVIHSLELLPPGGTLALFLKTSALEGKERRDKIFKITPPVQILQFSERVVCAKNGDFKRMEKIGSAVAYAWYIWKKGYKGDTIIKWI